MASSIQQIIARVTANGRSRLGFYPIAKSQLVGNTLWMLLQTPDGGHTVAWERLSQKNGVWDATLFSDEIRPAFVASPQALFDLACNNAPAVQRWQGYLEKMQAQRTKLREFRRKLAPNDTLKLNGYAFTLVRRLITGHGWVVKRDGTELRLEGSNFDKAVTMACPA